MHKAVFPIETTSPEQREYIVMAELDHETLVHLQRELSHILTVLDFLRDEYLTHAQKNGLVIYARSLVDKARDKACAYGDRRSDPSEEWFT